MAATQTSFSVMVAFEPPNASREGTDAWERYFKAEVLEKWETYSCLRSYRWEQEKSGWGKLVHQGRRDEQNRGATTLLQELLVSKGFRKGANPWGSERFEPDSDDIPMVLILRAFSINSSTLLMQL